jgi:3-hydroxymyristoyl/3-hydroxydecanoyl-(acyl carrier protein) dehydratase
MSAVLEFVGEPFDAVAWTTAGQPDTSLAGPAATQPGSGPSAPPWSDAPAPAGPAGLPALAQLRATLVVAHASVLRAQTSLQRRRLAAAGAAGAAGAMDAVPVLGPARTGPARTDPARTGPAEVDLARVHEAAPFQPLAQSETFKPLAYSATTRLDAAQLSRLADGDIAGVFGPGHDPGGCSPDARLAAGTEVVLAEVTALRRRGYGGGQGQVTARRVPGTDVIEATVQAAQVYALYTGLHLCLADATFVRLEAEHTRLERAAPGGDVDSSVDLEVDVEVVDLIPRPWLRVHARSGTTRVAHVVVALREKPGVPVGLELGGVAARWLGRKSSRGEPVLLNEFHMTHLARGDQGIAFGPEFARYSGRKTTRLPSGGLMLVDRIVAVEGQRGKLDGGRFLTEYDSPADAWYYPESANASAPHCFYLETSLQAALLSGYFLGATLATPDAEMSLRNLSGTATVLREVELRDSTIRQNSELESTTTAPGTILQGFNYTLATDGEPFYQGQTMFGYFSEQILSSQTGLDGGRSVPTWLEAERPESGVRVIDVAARRADPTARLCSRNHLALVDQVTVVDGGGRYGQGYLHAQRPIDPNDALFEWHFPLDPVMPGSFGVEAVIQTMQEWLLDTDVARGMHEPGFIIPVGVPFSWKYRGQFLRDDGLATLEVHVKAVETRSGRLRATADASMWKPGIRIYELTDVAVELREKGSAPW